MPRHDPSEKTKSEILSTAVALFKEKGWNNVNIEDVVKKVGVTRGAFYHYFKSREELIIAAVDKIFFDNNPFTIVAKETGLNALEKLRLVHKLSIAENMDNAEMINEVYKAVENPIIFKSEFISQFNTVAPFIEKLLIEGNEDGSLSVQYPKQAAQVIALLPNIWLSHNALQVPHQEIVDRFSFFSQMLVNLGIPIFDDELKELSMKYYETVKEQLK